MNNFDDHTLLLIFEFLDGNTLKACSAVCASWNFLISNTTTMMNKLKLSVNGETKGLNLCKGEIKELKSLQRQYRALKLERVSLTSGLLVSLEEQAFNLHEVTLSCVDMRRQTFLKMLGGFPSLEKLTLHRSMIHWCKYRKIAPTPIPSLKSLTLSDSPLDILECIGQAGLQKLEMTNYLMQSKSIANFFEMHAETLEELQLTSTQLKSVVTMIMTKLTNLKVLRINEEVHNDSSSDYNLIPKHDKLKTLHLYGKIDKGLQTVEAWLRIFHNIRELIIPDYTHKDENAFLSRIAEKLPKLEKLQFHKKYREMTLPFQQLKEYKICCFVDSNEKFIAPNLEVLTITDFVGRDYQLFETLASMPRLREVNIDSTIFPISEHFLNAIHQLKIKKLNISQASHFSFVPHANEINFSI
jgi:hypothetical protein